MRPRPRTLHGPRLGLHAALRATPHAALLLLLTAGVARAATLKVPSSSHPSIQSAIDAAGPGDIIKVKKNVYVEELLIEGKSELTLKGGGALISGPPGGTGVTILNSFGISIVGLDVAAMEDGLVADTVIGLELRSCTLSGLVTGMTLFDCDAVQIIKCRVQDTSEVGIAVGSIGAGEHTLITIEKCKLTNTGDDAIRLFDCTLLRIARCKILDFGGTAIGSFGSASVETATVEKNVIGVSDPDDDELDHGDGIRLRGSGITVRKNKLTLSPKSICVNVAGSDITVEKNKLAGGGTGVQLSKLDSGSVATNVVILGNTMKGESSIAVVTNPDTLGTVIQGNKASGCNRGMLLWGTAHQVIANTVKSAEWTGIENNGAVVTFSGNVATGSGNCDFRDWGIDTILDGNLFPNTDC